MEFTVVNFSTTVLLYVQYFQDTNSYRYINSYENIESKKSTVTTTANSYSENEKVIRSYQGVTKVRLQKAIHIWYIPQKLMKSLENKFFKDFLRIF